MTTLPAIIADRLPATVTPLIRWQTASVFGPDGQFDGAVVSAAAIGAGATLRDLTAALAVVERSLLPCADGGVVVEALAPMYATRRNRPGETRDEEVSLSILAERLKHFPRDVIAEAGAYVIDTTPWMPAVSELLQLIDRKMRPRRALKAALEAAIARMSAPARPQIEAPKVEATAAERSRSLIAYRRGKGDMRGAATEERWLAHHQGREVEAWAVPLLAEITAEEERRRREFMALASEPAPAGAPTASAARLAELARQRREQLGGRDEAAA